MPFVRGGHPNPLLRLWELTGASEDGRRRAIRDYAFAVPTDNALDAIARHAPYGVVEVGAGTGYWAWQLEALGVDVIAYDLLPPPSAENEWFAGRQAWTSVCQGDERAAAAHPDRCLLLCWPTANTVWPGDAVEAFHGAGGTTIAVVGEGAGGRTGDDRFHALLGELDRCYPCRLAFADGICTCAVPRLYRPAVTVDIPTWSGFEDRLVIYRPAAERRRRLARRRR